MFISQTSKRLFIAFAITFLTTHVFTFGQTTIHGLISSQETSQQVSFANVILINAQDSSFVKGELSDEEGKFRFTSIRKGGYFLKISSLGFAGYSSSIIRVNGQNEIDLDKIILTEKVVQLSEVEIEAKKPIFEQKIDRIIVNVQNSISASGSNVLDLLEKSPGVAVDRMNNRISLMGKDGVVVSINGKSNRMPLEAAMQLLAGMNSNQVEKIELITNPPASFDAEGTGGVINIVLKQSTDKGTNGSYSLMAGYGLAEKNAANINFNHRRSKLNIYGDYSYNRDHTLQTFTSYRTVEFGGNSTYLSGKNDREAVVGLQNARLGFDYQLGKKTILGGLISGYNRNWDMDAVNQNEMYENDEFKKSLLGTTHEINHWKHLVSNANLQHNFTENQSLSINLDYVIYRNNNPNDYLNQYYQPNGEFDFEEIVNVEKRTPIRIGVAKADYSGVIGEKIKWEAGLKTTMSNFTNAIKVDREKEGIVETDIELSQTYHLKENIYAGYTSFAIKPNSKTNLNLGLRYEHTISDLGTAVESGIISRNYGNFFPSFSLSKELTTYSTFQFAYQRRITRPTYNDMAPFVIFLSPSTFFAGNANILPSISNNIKADYRWKTLLLSLSLTNEKDAIANFQPSLNVEENKLYFASENLDNRKTANLMIALPIKITSWWEMQNTFTGNLTAIKSEYQGEDLSFLQKSFRINTSQSFKLPQNFAAEISAFYQSENLFGITLLEPSKAINLGLQKKFDRINATLNFSAIDIFASNNWNWSVEESKTNFNMGGSFIMEPRSFRLTFTQSFGNAKLKSKRYRETGSEAERRRVNN